MQCIRLKSAALFFYHNISYYSQAVYFLEASLYHHMHLDLLHIHRTAQPTSSPPGQLLSVT
jgi:hypothetical protein